MRGDPAAAVRALLAEGEEVRALEHAEACLERGPRPDQAIALRTAGAQAARALGDAAKELALLEGAEELAAVHAPGSLGAVRLQLGLALLRHGRVDPARRALEDSVALLADDPPSLERARRALADARARAQAGVPEPEGSGVRESVRKIAAIAASRIERARVLRTVEKLLETDPDAPLDKVLDDLLGDVILAVQAERGFVLLAEPDGLKVRVARDARGQPIVHPELEVSFSIARTAATEGRPVVAVKPSDDPRFMASRSAKRLDLTAVCAVPLRFRRECLGVIVLDRKKDRRTEGFTKADELLVTTFARGAAGIAWRQRREEATRLAHLAFVEQLAIDAGRRASKLAADGIKGSSGALQRLLSLLEKVAAHDVRVVIRGETGTGKELIAQTIHRNGPRAKHPFVPVNCGALSDGVLESELFGNVSGAFTGATGAKGLVRSAHGGTLFLDEIAEASPKLQVSLLRFLETGKVRAVGAATEDDSDVRVIAATHEDLEGLVASGRFRADLYHRLAAVTVRVPALRERPSDVPILAHHFAVEAARRNGGDARAEERAAAMLTPPVIEDLVKRPWWGNVRELRNFVEQLVTMGKAPAPLTAGRRRRKAAAVVAPPAPRDPVPTLRESERRTIVAALAACGGNKSKTAHALGISRRGLYYLMADHGIEA